MPYDERIRDAELRSAVGDEGLSDEVVSMIYLETIRQFFLNTDNFSSYVLRNRVPTLLWTANADTSAVRIVRGIDWVPENMGKTPEIVIRNQGSTWTSNQVGSVVDPWDNEQIEDPEIVSTFILSRTVVWTISTSATEARNIGWELGMFLAAFAQPLQREYGFTKLAIAGAGAPVLIAERKGYWGVPIVVAAQWENTQELIEQQPRVAEIRMEQETLEE